MTRAKFYRSLAIVAGLVSVSAFALPALAQDYSRHHEDCYDRNGDAEAGGAVAGAVIGGAAAGPVGVVVGAAVGSGAGDDSVHCRYERDGYSYGDGYRGYGYGDDNYSYGDRNDRYSEGYGEGYGDAAARFNGSDRGYRADEDYYARRPTYHDGYYDGYGYWHPASDDAHWHR